MASKLEQINRDTYGPPNRCTFNKGNGQCKQAAARNLDGTWGGNCQKHKDMISASNKKRRESEKCTPRQSMEYSNDEEEEEEVPTCVDCNQEARPRKDGKGYCMRCTECGETQSSLIQQLQHVQTLKRKYIETEKFNETPRFDIKRFQVKISAIQYEMGKLQEKKEEYERAIETIKQLVVNTEELKNEYETAKKDLADKL